MTGPEIKSALERLEAEHRWATGVRQSRMDEISKSIRDLNVRFEEERTLLKHQCPGHVSDGGPVMNSYCVYCRMYLG